VTIPVGTHGLTCLDGNDYAAVALWMQATANATNEALTGINASIGTFLDRPYLQITNSSALNVDSASGTVGPEGFIGAVQQPPNGVMTANDLDTTMGPLFRLPAGIYLLQSTIAYTVATPNNNTSRTLMVAGLGVDNGITDLASTYRNLYMYRVLEGGGAGNPGAISVQGPLVSDGTTTRKFFAFFSHANTSSVIAVAAGAWRSSIMYLGSGLVV